MAKPLATAAKLRKNGYMTGVDLGLARNMDNTVRPGAILKALRLERGWRHADVAARTGFQVSILSKIENDRIALSYDKIARLSKAMGVDIGVFFAEQAEPPKGATSTGGRRSVARRGEGRVMETETYTHRFLATDLLNKRFVPIIGEVRARSIKEFSSLIRHSGEEFLYIIEGALELHSDLYAPLRLEAGDSIYFDSGMGHAYVAVGEGTCRVLTICSGEETQLMTTFEKKAAPSPDAAAPEPAAEPAKRTRRRKAAAR